MSGVTQKPECVFPLNDLSNEILTLIVSHVDDKRSLLGLSKVSRRFNEIATPFLYAFVTHGDAYNDDRSKDLPLILRTLLARPELAKRVKKFEGYAYDSNTGYEPNRYSAPIDAVFEKQDWARLRQAIKAIVDDEGAESDFVESTREGNWDALVTVFLSLLSGLEEIYFSGWGYDFERLDAYLKKVADAQRGNGPLALERALPKLRKVSLGYWDTENGMSPAYMLDWMRLKSMRSISGHMIMSEEDWGEEQNASAINPDDPPAYDFGHIEDISFTYSFVSSSDLFQMLHGCSNLKSLTLELGGCSDSMAAFEPPKYLPVLELVKDTLETLVMSDENGAMGFSRLENYPLGSLRNMSKLKKISIESDILFGSLHEAPDGDEDEDEEEDNPEGFASRISIFTDLPPNLETLVQARMPNETLFTLLANLKNYPSLKTLDLGWARSRYSPSDPPPSKYPWPTLHVGFTRDEVRAIRRTCVTAGVVIKIHEVPPPCRILKHWVDKTGLADGTSREFDDAGNTRYFSVEVRYPYVGWEELCEEFECDPKTGWRWDMPPPEGLVLLGFKRVQEENSDGSDDEIPPQDLNDDDNDDDDEN